MIAEIGQRSMTSLHRINDATMLKASAKEHMQMPRRKRDENIEGGIKEN